MYTSLYPGVTLQRATPGSAGFDLTATYDTIIQSGGKAVMPTGIKLRMLPGQWAFIKERSSIGLLGGLCLAGVIDSDYRDELRVIMFNIGYTPLSFKVGDRFANLVIMNLAVPTGDLCKVSLQEWNQMIEEEKSYNKRKGGFGSTNTDTKDLGK